MTAIQLQAFQGTIPKAAKTILAQNQAQQADNVRLYGGDLFPWRKPKFIYAPANTNPVVSIYHVTHDSDDRWLTFECDTDVVEGPVPNLDENRLYYTSACTAPRKTNWDMLSTGPGPYPTTTAPMGVPNPTGTLALSASGTGSGTAVTRSYLYTWVNTFGSVEEETGPSDPNSVNWQSGQTIHVVRSETPPPSGSGYNVTKWRIYRTVTSSSGTALYQLVAELPIATTTYDDSLSDAAIPGDVLATTDYDPPPDDMQGLVLLPNGILAGFVGNEVYFCEPYIPHAWPRKYVQTLGYAIVGLAVYEQNLVVMTKQCPYIITGIMPDAMTVTRISLWEPCIQKRSIASDMSGACYASPNGLVGISSLVQGVVSSGLMRRQEWVKNNPQLFSSTIYNGQYIGFAPDTNGDSSTGGWGMILDKSDDSALAASTKTDVAAFSNAPPLTRMDYWAIAAYVDKETAALYVVDKHTNWIYQIDGDELDYMIGEWKSKRFVLGQPVNFSCIQVDADYEATDEPLFQLVQRYVQENTDWLATHTTDQLQGQVNCMQVNGGGNRSGIGSTMGTVNGSPMIWDIPSIFDFRSVNIQVYAHDVLVFTYNPEDLDPVRMLSGFKARQWEIKSSANFRVRSISLATSMAEIKTI